MFDIEQSIIFTLAKAYQHVTADFKEEFEGCGITPPQFILLAFLWEKEGLSQVELSQVTKIDRASMVGIIDRLEKSGFLTRQTCSEDRRINRVWLTDKGKSLEQEFCQVACRVMDRITVRITPEGCVRLQDLLVKLLN